MSGGKWCPFTRVRPISAGYASYNRRAGSPEPDDDAVCIKDRCACWRTSKTLADLGDGPGIVTDVIGWCGLAGKPEVV